MKTVRSKFVKALCGNKVYQWVWVLAILMLVSCATMPTINPPPDGAVYPMQAGTTLWGMRQVVVESLESSALLRPDGKLVLLWQMPSLKGWAFVLLEKDGAEAWNFRSFFKDGGNGNLINGNTLEDLVIYLQSKGYTKVPVATIPGFQLLKQGILNGAQWVSSTGSCFTTIIVFPISPTMMKMLPTKEGDA
jgi:hypothetical protein